MAVLSDLLAWNEQDPPDDFERNRNEVVYAYQGNRNPYIDHPEYVCLVFGSNCPGNVANPDPFTAMGASPTQVDLNWGLNANSNSVVLAYNTTNTFGTPTGSYTANDPIPGGGTVLYVGNATSFNHNGLLPQMYYYKMWSYDATPEYSSGVTANASPLLPEPTYDPTNFVVTGTTWSSIDLSWTDVNNAPTPAGYLVKASTGAFTNPIDGIPKPNSTFVKNVTQGIQAVTFDNLDPNTLYYFKIYPYTNNGANIDYKTNSPSSTYGITDPLPANVIIYAQDFDLNTSWTYTHDVAFFNHVWGTDGYYGIIDISNAGPLDYEYFSDNILGENDMNDEGDFGTAGVATVDFTNADISNYSDVVLTFDWDVAGYGLIRQMKPGMRYTTMGSAKVLFFWLMAIQPIRTLKVPFP